MNLGNGKEYTLDMGTITPFERNDDSAELGSLRDKLRKEYDELLPLRTALLRELELFLEGMLASVTSTPKIRGRVKSFESYFKKYTRCLEDGVSPSHISDIIGIRIICTFLENLSTVENLLSEKFKVIEVDHKGVGHTLREFGYDSIHLLITVPESILGNRDSTHCKTAEVQIRTIMQDAWAEVEHELIYKSDFNPFDTPLKRKLAAVNASLSLADIVFQEIRNYQRELSSQLMRRRDSFFRQIENSIDSMLFTEPIAVVQDDRLLPQRAAARSASGSIDELLLEALNAHNKNDFPHAIAIYTQILDMKPVRAVSTLIYKHRGMAYFASARYEEAIADFSESLELDPKSYSVAYYKGIVCSVLGRHPQALDAFDLSLAINPYQHYCLYRRAQAYYHLGDYPQALGDCEAALALKTFEAAEKLKELLLSKLKM